MAERTPLQRETDRLRTEMAKTNQGSARNTALKEEMENLYKRAAEAKQ
jgi:hypothetical protein